MEAILPQHMQMQQQQQEQQEQRQQQTHQPQGAPQTAGIRRQFHQAQLNMRGCDNIERLSGGEDQWQRWSWKIKTAVSGTNGELAGILNAAEADGLRNIEETLNEDVFVDGNIAG